MVFDHSDTRLPPMARAMSLLTHAWVVLALPGLAFASPAPEPAAMNVTAGFTLPPRSSSAASYSTETPQSGKSSGTGRVYKQGDDIEFPKLQRDVRPNYTNDALKAKIEGSVLVEAVVLPNGRVGEAKIVRSLDTKYGLDKEALKAAKQWRFVPGRKDGQPVPVLVTIELTFTIKK